MSQKTDSSPGTTTRKLRLRAAWPSVSLTFKQVPLINSANSDQLPHTQLKGRDPGEGLAPKNPGDHRLGRGSSR